MDFMSKIFAFCRRYKIILGVILCILVGCISAKPVVRYATDVKNHTETISVLDEKRTDVLALAAASGAASTAITILPGDVGTPIADELADLSGYFVFILGAIYLEKYLVTVSGYIAFRWLVPIACALWGIGFLVKNWKEEYYYVLRRLALKLTAFGLVLVFVVPVSTRISSLIEETNAASMQATLEEAEESTAELESISEENEDKSSLVKVWETIKGGVSGFVTKFKAIISNMIDAIAVFLVTSCVIPILVLVALVWIVKILFGIDTSGLRKIPIPKGRNLRRKLKSHFDEDSELEDEEEEFKE